MQSALRGAVPPHSELEKISVEVNLTSVEVEMRKVRRHFSGTENVAILNRTWSRRSRCRLCAMSTSFSRPRFTLGSRTFSRTVMPPSTPVGRPGETLFHGFFSTKEHIEGNWYIEIYDTNFFLYAVPRKNEFV
jgi:hypothetical protein